CGAVALAAATAWVAALAWGAPRPVASAGPGAAARAAGAPSARPAPAPAVDEQGYRLACQTYVNGDVTVAWDPDQIGLDEGSRVYDKLKQVWLAKDDGA
ncbi:MAG: hypothetical protein HZB15_10140, partial [Actinobacteria bacterium]|nr:hypothetical protein [Actinomycetota bacterium]